MRRFVCKDSSWWHIKMNSECQSRFVLVATRHPRPANKCTGFNLPWDLAYAKQKSSFENLSHMAFSSVAGTENKWTVVATQKVSQTVILRSSLPLLDMYPKIKNRDSNRYWYTHIHGGIVHTSQIEETIQIFINWWMDKQDVVYTCKRLILRLKRERNSATCLSTSEL